MYKKNNKVHSRSVICTETLKFETSQLLVWISRGLQVYLNNDNKLCLLYIINYLYSTPIQYKTT